MNQIILIGRVIYFDCTNKTLKLRVPNKNLMEEFIVNFPNQPENIMRYMADKFAYDSLVKIKGRIANKKSQKKLVIIADTINFYN